MNALTPVNPVDTEHVTRWLGRFETALQAGDRGALVDLFGETSHWRDILALTWTITPKEDRPSIADLLIRAGQKAHARNFTVAPGRTPPRRVKRLGIDVIEAIFAFETDTGRCHGVLRLPADDPKRAWVLATSLTEIKGHEPPIRDRRPTGAAYSRNFGGANWADLRRKEQAFEDREPAVAIIGGSQFGITMAARLKLLDVDTLVIEKTARVGDAWRNRYHSLALHNQVGRNHFPYLPFPENWPKYLSKDMLADFIEFYARAMECNVWTSTTFIGGSYDEAKGAWNVEVRREDGSQRVLHPRHVIFANGVMGAKKKPEVPGLDDFAGEVMHTEDYTTGAAYRGKRVLVLGAATSGHDCAQDLHAHGADVTMIQRGSTAVVSLESSSMNDAAYLKENVPLEDADLITVTPTFGLLKQAFVQNTLRVEEHDKALLDGLRARGFKLDSGPGCMGYQMRVRARHGGYYLNCGCSDLIASGAIGLIQWEDARHFVADGLLMKDGRVEKADAVITATGYYTQEEAVRHFLGDEIADRVGPVWGIDEQGELRNMFAPTPQKGLWFVGGGLAHSRIYSHYLALQIKARELGLIEPANG